MVSLLRFQQALYSIAIKTVSFLALSKQPPWGNDISEDITDLSNYFVTSDGEDFLTILLHALEKAKDVNEDVNIESM